MDGKRGISDTILSITAIAVCLAVSACSKKEIYVDVDICIDGAQYETKAAMPDEEKISNINLLIFDSRGMLEYSIFDKSPSHNISLLKGERYTICACVNFGSRINVQDLNGLEGIFFHLAYPDEYREGMPMAAVLRNFLITGEDRISLEAERLMSKVSVRIDRSLLSKDVEMSVTGIRIGNCPKKVRAFAASRAESEDDCFPEGFSHSGSACEKLNRENYARLSEYVSLYMLENMQGIFSPDGISDDREKVFEAYDIRNKICSYIELDMEYISPYWTSISRPLTYRFYLGENANNLDIERNSHYRITVCPEDDGLRGDGWRVDKSGLKYTGERSLVQYPAGYISGNIGDRVHIGCTLTPSNTPFDVGREYMEADRAEGLYTYEIDPDGHGATLTLTGPGQGLIYMEAGEPVNDAALFVIEINRPT